MRSNGNQKQAEALDVLLAMMAKEEILLPIDYHFRSTLKGTPITSNAHSGTEHNGTPVNDSDREKMCEWYYEMSDFLKIDRATASRSMAYLDRFMCSSTHQAQIASISRDEYQLVALTTLFIAIKLFERLNIKPSHVSYLSRGRYTSEEVVRMEIAVLSALEWKVASPTKMDFAVQIIDAVFPDSVGDDSPSIIGNLRDLATLQIQVSDFDYSFSIHKQSVVAFAAVLNAYDMKKWKMAKADQATFLSRISTLMTFFDKKELAATVDKLRILIDPTTANSNTNNHSPSSVSSNINSYYHYNDDSSIYTQNVEVLAGSLDSAFQSMEDSLDMAHFLCCGTPLTTAPSSHNLSKKNSFDSSISFDEESTYKRSRSLDLKKIKRITTNNNNNHSPTSIVTILFGATS